MDSKVVTRGINMKEKLVVIVGPTAVGKTKLSIEMAKRVHGEIISGDSMQVYRNMDIGTAKISVEEMEGIPHHLLDIKNPDEAYSAAAFQSEVKRCVTDITSRGKLPILVGGSGLYIQAVLYDYHFSKQERNEAITAKLERQIELEGIMSLYTRLTEVDPEQAKKIHPNNHRRVVRALEIYEATGGTMTELQKNQRKELQFDVQLVGLEMERQLLYDRINNRVDEMIEKGLVSEVRQLVAEGYGECQSMQAIGYKELIPYIEGQCSMEEAIETLKQNSRRYAKRQYTWFKNKLDINWYSVEPETINEKFRIIINDLAGFLKER